MKNITPTLLVLTMVITPAVQSQQISSSALPDPVKSITPAVKAEAYQAGKEQSRVIKDAAADIYLNVINPTERRSKHINAMTGHNGAKYITADYKPGRDNAPRAANPAINRGPNIFVREYKML